MIIDTESPEGRALVALAKFGDYALDNLNLWGHARETATDLGLIVDGPRGWYDRTDLAKIPEGI